MNYFFYHIKDYKYKVSQKAQNYAKYYMIKQKLSQKYLYKILNLLFLCRL